MAHGGVFQLDLDEHTTSQPLEEEDSENDFDDDTEFTDAVSELVCVCVWVNERAWVCLHLI